MDRLFKLLQWAPACALAALAFHPGAHAEPWQKVADQYQFFDVDKAGDYRFGVGDRWEARSLLPGRYYCFLQPDPAPGVYKTCQVDLANGAPATPLPPSITYYFSDCQDGADSRCKAGDDANDGLSAEKPKRRVQALDFSKLPAGARVALAKGGAWSADQTVVLDNHLATSAQRIVVDAYTPTWGGAAKPRYVFTGAQTLPNEDDLPAFRFKCGGTAENPVCGNMVFDGIEFVGTTQRSVLFYAAWVIENITWQNTHMSGAGSGVTISNNPKAVGRSHNIRLAGNHISRMHKMGVMINANDLLIENNTFLDNALSGSVLDHHIYLSCQPSQEESAACVRNVVRNNLVEDKSFAGGGVMVVMHDLYRGLLIERNTVRNTFAGGALNQVFGIGLAEGNLEPRDIEGCIDCVIQNNTLVDTGQAGIDLSQVRNVRALRNTIVFTKPAEVQCFRIGADLGKTTVSIALDKVEISQNTCYIAKPYAQSAGVWFQRKYTEGGYNHRIANNLFYMGPTRQLSADTRLTSYCYNVDLPANRFGDSSSNACFGANDTSGLTHGTPYNWSSVTADPMIAAAPTAANPAVKLLPSSPAQGKGAP